MEESLQLARDLVDAGAHTTVCTPHYSRRFPTEHTAARAVLAELQSRLITLGVPLQCLLAAEVSPAAAIDSPRSELQQRRMGRQHLLVELEPRTPAGAVMLVVRRLAELGLRPVFAHPERCRAVRADPSLLDPARTAGALLQVVAPSLMGRWGSAIAEAAWSLLASGRVDLLASDAHRPAHVAEQLSRALRAVASRLGDKALLQMTETVPAQVLDLGHGPRIETP
jgi:protein-tyrosine phosphatase